MENSLLTRKVLTRPILHTMGIRELHLTVLEGMGLLPMSIHTFNQTDSEIIPYRMEDVCENEDGLLFMTAHPHWAISLTVIPAIHRPVRTLIIDPKVDDTNDPTVAKYGIYRTWFNGDYCLTFNRFGVPIGKSEPDTTLLTNNGILSYDVNSRTICVHLGTSKWEITYSEDFKSWNSAVITDYNGGTQTRASCLERRLPGLGLTERVLDDRKKSTTYYDAGRPIALHIRANDQDETEYYSLEYSPSSTRVRKINADLVPDILAEYTYRIDDPSVRQEKTHVILETRGIDFE